MITRMATAEAPQRLPWPVPCHPGPSGPGLHITATRHITPLTKHSLSHLATLHPTHHSSGATAPNNILSSLKHGKGRLAPFAPNESQFWWKFLPPLK